MIIDITSKMTTAIAESTSGKPEIDICKTVTLRDGTTGSYTAATLRFESAKELERFSDEIALHTNKICNG